MEEPKRIYPNFKTHILLPVLFILTTAIAVCFLAVEDFLVGIGPVVIWLYFAVSLAYSILAIVDVFINKEKSKKLKIFVLIMSALAVISNILYFVFYLIAR